MARFKEYYNGEITVVWKPDLCIHSKNCVHGLPKVFKPTEKPWVQVENSNSNNIIETVNTCPSGALTYYINATGIPKTETEKMKEYTKVEVVPLGPLMVYGSLSIKHENGSEEDKQPVTAFCRCGQSNNKPFCDGSHKQI